MMTGATCLIAPVGYQGAKHRIADAILDKIDLEGVDNFFDLCCGGGSVSLALLRRGFPPGRITMVDRGPWGRVWAEIGAGTFSLDRFECLCRAIPPEPRRIDGHLREIARLPIADNDLAYTFLLLQAGSFGGKAIWTEGDRWRNWTARSYWEPTATSSRRSPVNPMMPMPATILDRLRQIVPAMRGVRGMCADVATVRPGARDVVYLDPPYGGTTAYGHTIDATAFAKASAGRVYVSEGLPLTDEAVFISAGRSKGGISGDRKVSANEEWLSLFAPK